MNCRLHESEQMEEFHRDKIRELSEDLSQFRQAVEVVAGEHPSRKEETEDRRKRSVALHPCRILKLNYNTLNSRKYSSDVN